MVFVHCWIGRVLQFFFLLFQFLVSEPVRAAEKLRLFFSDLWNVVDAFILLLFYIGFVLRFQPGYVSYARCFYGLSVSIVIPRIMELFAVSPHLGPFVHIIGMLVGSFEFNKLFVAQRRKVFDTFLP